MFTMLSILSGDLVFYMFKSTLMENQFQKRYNGLYFKRISDMEWLLVETLSRNLFNGLGADSEPNTLKHFPNKMPKG